MSEIEISTSSNTWRVNINIAKEFSNTKFRLIESSTYECTQYVYVA